MPKLEVAVYDLLTANTRLADLVVDRVYPVRMPEGATLPCVVWQRVSATRTYDHNPYETTAAYTRARIQFSCWSNSPLEAVNVGEAVLLALSGFSGSVGSTLIGSSFVEMELDDYDSEARLYRRLLDVAISYEDPASGT